MTLQLLLSDFLIYEAKFYFIFYQCNPTLEIIKASLYLPHRERRKTKRERNSYREESRNVKKKAIPTTAKKPGLLLLFLFYAPLR